MTVIIFAIQSLPVFALLLVLLCAMTLASKVTHLMHPSLVKCRQQTWSLYAHEAVERQGKPTLLRTKTVGTSVGLLHKAQIA